MKALSVNFWPTCSNQCIFCFCHEHDLLSERLDPPSISSPEAVARALMDHRDECNWVILSGNEPTLNPDLPLTILLAKRTGYQVDLRTNGRRLKDASFCRTLLKVGVDRVDITLLGSDAETHDFLSGAKGAFVDTVEGIRNLVSMWDPEKIGIFNVVTRYNYTQLQESVVFCHALGARDIQFNFVYHTDKNITPRLTDVEEHLKNAIETAHSLGMKARVYGFPACFLGNHAGLASELSSSNEVVLGGRVTDYKKMRVDLGKKKTAHCEGCALNGSCEGTWKSYYEIYGEEEFRGRSVSEKSRYQDGISLQ